jgi:hypothetical protein
MSLGWMCGYRSLKSRLRSMQLLANAANSGDVGHEVPMTSPGRPLSSVASRGLTVRAIRACSLCMPPTPQPSESTRRTTACSTTSSGRSS